MNDVAIGLSLVGGLAATCVMAICSIAFIVAKAQDLAAKAHARRAWRVSSSHDDDAIEPALDLRDDPEVELSVEPTVARPQAVPMASSEKEVRTAAELGVIFPTGEIDYAEYEVPTFQRRAAGALAAAT